MKISEAFDSFTREEVLAMNYSVNTFKAYKFAEKSVISYFGNIPIKKLDISAVHDYYLWLIDRVSKNTARRYVSDLRAVLKYCRKRHIKVMNPDEIRTPRAEKKVARFLSEEEYKRFLDAAGQPMRGYSAKNRVRNVLIIKMLYETGLRVSELCALDRNTIHNREFTVVGKSKDPRPCFITEEMEQLLKEYLALRNDTNVALFIADQNGKRITSHNVQRVFRNVSKKAGVGTVTPHTLRHSYATRFIERGVDIRIVSALLGHQSLATTQNYTHVTDYLLRCAYEMAMENSAKLPNNLVAKLPAVGYN